MARRLKRTWIDSYMEYVSDTESPVAYNMWCAISAISASLKRNAKIPYGKYDIFPNQYIILVGPPGIGKGTAINPIVDMVKKAQTVNFISDRVTSEKIVEKLSIGFQQVVTTPTGGIKTTTGDSSATIVSTELPIFLQTSEWMLPLMCEMWDRNEFSYETKTKSSYNAKDLCVGLLAGCVPDYIRKLNRDATAAVTGGFTSRCIFVFASDKQQLVAWPKDRNTFQKLEDDLINDLQHIGNTCIGEYRFDNAARQMWENQYQQMNKSDPFASEVLIGFISRMKSHIFKTAMALSAAENDSRLIQIDHLRNAIVLVNGIRDSLDITFRSVGESPLAAAQDRVLRFLESRGRATYQEILKFNYRHVTDEQLRSILLVLQAAGFITEVMNGNKLDYIHTGKPLNKKTP